MSYAKAVAAFVTPFILTLFTPLGVDGDTTTSQFIELLITAALTAVAVYFIPNKK